MTPRHAQLLAALAGCLLADPYAARAQSAPPPQIWLYMMPYTVAQVDGKQGWTTLFTSGAAWPSWMRQVRVVSISSDWYGTSNFPPDGVMRATAARLARADIAFAATSLAQSWVHEPSCGQGVESYTDPPGNLAVARKLRAYGFTLAYVTMDEPLWYGHYYTGPNACRSSIDNAAARAAAIMREYIKVFPNVVIGDTEPVSLTTQPDWRSAYRAWQRAFAARVGRQIRFLRADVQWTDPAWQADLARMFDFARGIQLPVGIIYNATLPAGTSYTPPADATRTTRPQEATNARWLAIAAGNFTRIEQRDGLVPDQAVFESWSTLPIRTVTTPPSAGYPDGEPGEDELIRQYLDLHS
jgi:hypothetical protein